MEFPIGKSYRQDSGDAQKLVQSAVKTIELNERQVLKTRDLWWVSKGGQPVFVMLLVTLYHFFLLWGM